MFLLAIPMVILYFAAVGVALLHDRRVARRARAFEAELA
jgi:sec-independent protein translocase protein TatC